MKYVVSLRACLCTTKPNGRIWQFARVIHTLIFIIQIVETNLRCVQLGETFANITVTLKKTARSLVDAAHLPKSPHKDQQPTVLSPMDQPMDHVANQNILNLVLLEVKQPMLTHGHGKLDCTKMDVLCAVVQSLTVDGL